MSFGLARIWQKLARSLGKEEVSPLPSALPHTPSPAPPASASIQYMSPQEAREYKARQAAAIRAALGEQKPKPRNGDEVGNELEFTRHSSGSRSNRDRGYEMDR